MYKIALGITAAGILAVMLMAQTPRQGSADRIVEPPSMEQQVLSKIHRINRMEMDVGRMAEHKSDSAEVRRYGQRLVRDHQISDNQVTRLANELNLTLSEEQPAAPDQSGQMALTRKLDLLSGQAFDNVFLPAMVDGHADAVAALKDAEQKLLPASPVRQFVDRLLPILQQHHDLAVDLERQGK